MIHSLKYLRSPTLKCKDIRIRKLKFVTKTQLLSMFSKFSLIFMEDKSNLISDSLKVLSVDVRKDLGILFKFL